MPQDARTLRCQWAISRGPPVSGRESIRDGYYSKCFGNQLTPSARFLTPREVWLGDDGLVMIYPQGRSV
jgi:hypothetical protein